MALRIVTISGLRSGFVVEIGDTADTVENVQT